MATPIFRFLDTVGNGTGTKNANVNGVVTPVPFKIVPPAGARYRLHRMMVKISDDAVVSAEKYGGIAALANGIEVEVDLDGDTIDLLDGVPITGNADWGKVCYDTHVVDYGAGNNIILVRWTFAKSGAPLSLTSSDEFRVTVNDDLTGLVEHYFQVQGQLG